MTELFELSAPLSAQAHLIDSGDGLHLLVPNGSRLYDIDAATYAQLDRMRGSGDEDSLRELLRR
ncbi:MAG: hypothetical protein ACRDTT_20810, partial [Pseudonocardiaceae bacterium]